MVVRDYRAADLEAVRAIHDATQLDYKFPDLSSPLFVVTKVVECDGVVRACGGLYLQAEAYLWLDPSRWADPETKLEAVRALDRESIDAAWRKGIDQVVLRLPPEVENFGRRLIKLHWEKDRNWTTYSKYTSPK